MTTIERRIAALEKESPEILPALLVFVHPGEDSEQKVAEALAAKGVTEDEVRLMVVQFVAAPKRDEHGNLIESGSADASAT